MCTNKVRYFNKWSHSWMYSDCGKCPSCQQQKAFRRVKRIKNACWNGYAPLFVTLTYSNLSVPYIDKSEYNDSNVTNISRLFVRRDVDFRRVRTSGDYKMCYLPILKTEPIEVLDCCENDIFVDSEAIQALPDLKGKKDRVGVLYYKDLQNFEKRLRINLERRFDIHEPIYSFKVSEYGPTTIRPHFHLLVYVPLSHLEKCKCAIAESWPYDNKNVISRNIELARNAASYVSSYVNRGADFPKLLQAHPFKPKHSFSKEFGFQNLQFTLRHIVEGIERGSLRYTTTRNRNGFREVTDVLLPKYFLNRYFFKFKGYSRLSRCAVLELLRNPAILYRKSYEPIIKNVLNLIDEFTEIDWNQVNVVYNAISLRYKRFLQDFVYYEQIDGVNQKFEGLPDNKYSREIFADYWFRSLNIYSSNLYEDSLKGYEVDYTGSILQCYYNLEEVRKKRYSMYFATTITLLDSKTGLRERYPFDKRIFPISDLLPLIDQHPEISNPNLFQDVILQTTMMENIYHSMCKRRRVTNTVMSQQGINV